MDILIADDDPIALELLTDAVRRFGMRPTCATDGQQALDLLRTGAFKLIISDIEMPKISGIELCEEIRKRPTSGYVYIILLSSHSDTQSIVRGLEAGADDHIGKPFHPAELELRLKAARRLLGIESLDLMIFTLAKLADSRDNETGSHLERMRLYARCLAEQLATEPKFKDTIDGQFIRLIYATSPLHDIGKVGIPDSILRKPGKLTAEEFDIMKTHTLIGGETLRQAAEARPEAAFLAMAKDIALTHHERWNGQGYPHGLSGEDIPLCGRIVALADVYDALRSKRCYKDSFSHDKARNIILVERGEHFDPDVVDAFLACEAEFIRIGEENEPALAEDCGVKVESYLPHLLTVESDLAAPALQLN